MVTTLLIALCVLCGDNASQQTTLDGGTSEFVHGKILGDITSEVIIQLQNKRTQESEYIKADDQGEFLFKSETGHYRIIVHSQKSEYLDVQILSVPHNSSVMYCRNKKSHTLFSV